MRETPLALIGLCVSNLTSVEPIDLHRAQPLLGLGLVRRVRLVGNSLTPYLPYLPYQP
jgi:hypothetical protein